MSIFLRSLVVFVFPATLFALPPYLKDFPKESFHQLTSQKQVVGKSKLTLTDTPTGLIWNETSVMKLTLFKSPQTIETAVKTTTNEKMEVQDFSFVMSTDQSKVEITGKRLQNTMRLSILQAGQTQVKEIPIQEPLLVSPTIRPYLLMKGLPASKQKYDALLLEPSALTTVPVTLNVKKQKDRWLLDVIYLNQSLTSEIDARGEVLLETSSLAGLPIEARPIPAKDYESVKLETTKKDLVELAKVSFPEFPRARQASKLSVKISGIPLNEFALNRHRQKLRNSVLTIERESTPKQTLPMQSLAGQKGFEKYLEGDTSIPTFDSEVQKQAREIVGKENDLWKRALLVHKWVFSNLKKEPTISIPNALEVLKSKKGDCNEHAALYTALARAAGVPTRTVVGLVYSDRFYGERGFYYHAWVEVYSGKEWTAIDPTWDQIPADVTHIAFVEGSLDQQVKVIGLMGKIKLTPTEPLM